MIYAVIYHFIQFNLDLFYALKKFAYAFSIGYMSKISVSATHIINE